ncbi:MAG: TonB-dependent receptor [Bacteroidia bacterium]|nr:TonB-dependent receptor [Bacteroidia bacterium]
MPVFRIVALASLLLAAMLPAPAQVREPCRLFAAGQLLDAATGEPLPYARVFIPELNRGAFTDSMGNYRLLRLCPGSYTLTFSHLACEHYELKIELTASRIDTLRLSHKDSQAETIDIRAAKQPDPPTQAVARLRGRELEAGQGLSLAAAMRNLPGISTLQTGATIAKPVIHGLHSNRILILNNGIRLEGQQWGSEHAPEIDPFVAKQLTVIKGAAGVRYGSGAVGGVILVEPGELPDSPGVRGELHLQGFSNGRQGLGSALIEGQLPGHSAWAWRVQGTLKGAGTLHTPSYVLANTGLAEANFSLTARYQTLKAGAAWYYSRFHTRLGILQASHTGSLRDLQAAIERAQPLGSDTARFTYRLARPYQDVRHHLVKWRGYIRPDDRNTLSFTYAFQYNIRREYDLHRPRGAAPDGTLRAELNFFIYTHTAEAVWERSAGPWKHSTGIFLLAQNNRLEGRAYIPNFVSAGAEAFWIARRSWQRLTWESGIRYDYRWVYSAREERGIPVYTQQQFQRPSGATGLIWRLSPTLQLSANTGLAWRPPHVNELFSEGVHHGASSYEQGDSLLSAEQGLKSVLSLMWQRPRFSGELSVYHHHFFNFIYLRPNGYEITIRGVFPAFQYTQAPALLAGADLSLAYALTPRWTVRGQASYLRARNLAEQAPLPLMPANRMAYTVQYSSEAGRGGWRFHAEGSWRTVFRQRQAPQGIDLLDPPPGYSLLEGEAGLERHRCSFAFGVYNALNTEYRDYLNRFRYFAAEPGRNLYARLKILL